MSNEEHELDGFRDLVKPEYDDATQRLGQMIYNEDADNYTFEIVEMSEEEIAEELQRKEDNDQSAKDLARCKADGILYFDRAIAFVMRRKKNGNIGNNQANRIIKDMYPMIEPLYKGLWMLVKENLDDATVPSNEEIQFIFNKIKDKVNEYINNNI